MVTGIYDIDNSKFFSMDRHGKLGERMSNWDQKKEFMINALMRAGGEFEPAALNDHHFWNYVKAVGSNLPKSTAVAS
jgi:hypothetical protein